MYADEAAKRPMEEFDSWYIWLGFRRRWVLLTDVNPPETIDPSWSYAVPVDWVCPKTTAELHAEIAALRAEIAELKRHLNPPITIFTP